MQNFFQVCGGPLKLLCQRLSPLTLGIEFVEHFFLSNSFQLLFSYFKSFSTTSLQTTRKPPEFTAMISKLLQQHCIFDSIRVLKESKIPFEYSYGISSSLVWNLLKIQSFRNIFCESSIDPDTAKRHNCVTQQRLQMCIQTNRAFEFVRHRVCIYIVHCLMNSNVIIQTIINL